MRNFSRNRAEYKKTTSLTRVQEWDRKRAYWLGRVILGGRGSLSSRPSMLVSLVRNEWVS